MQIFKNLSSRTKVDDLIVITAGEDYCRYLVPLLLQRGNRVERPVQGLRMGFIPGRLYALVSASNRPS